MIRKVLIANRGEIACRVMRTCRAMGIATVAVYSEADRNALHAALADEAVCIGPAPARESYLNAAKILAAARDAGADAVHPGYGFLSENADFAQGVRDAGLIFIGPPPAAIRAMGGKSAAKALMEKAGVPLVPGYHGDGQDEKLLLKEAEKIGFPVLIKASAGGGGKGMRAVEKAADFAAALSGARREAQAAFGDAHVLVEKFLARPRHVEIQVFADAHGNCVYLFERDCSVQRRHQKVMEEAPAPGLSQKTREKMGAAAVAAAQAIGYEGAGTVEFLLDEKENFYFMEMNTRLQVEHPVTEMITGLDLVELQIRAARGEKLPFAQADLKISGHAFEARLYAEDPDNNFLPGAGRLRVLRFGGGARIDTGVRAGDDISIHYDPMIAKVIAHGPTREEALDRLSAALDETRVSGPKSNLNFLRALARHPAFRAGEVSTHFIENHRAALLPERQAASADTLALAVLGLLAARAAPGGGDPWDGTEGWRIGGREKEVFRFRDPAGEYEVSALRGAAGDYALTLPDAAVCVASFENNDSGFAAQVGGRGFHAQVDRDGDRLAVMHAGHHAELSYADPLRAGAGAEESAGRLTAPMPGRVVAVHAKAGGAVKKGQPLVIVEAMKMEHTVTAPRDGVIAAVHAAVGEQVDERRELVSFS